MMKKRYEEIEIQILLLNCEELVRTSGEVDEDETKYPIPNGWGGAN